MISRSSYPASPAQIRAAIARGLPEREALRLAAETDKENLMYIVTHTSPDLDAIGSCWLLQRFGGMHGCAVRFVNTGSPDAETLAGALAVVDTGREHDPARNRFDHHQDALLPSACRLVASALMDRADETEEDALLPAAEIVALIDAGDRGLSEAGQSRQIGLHAIYSGGHPEDDAGSLAYGYQLLDALYQTALRRAEGRRALATTVAYRSADGLLIALKDAPRAATGAAFEEGARLVLFADYAANAIGIQRASEWSDPHVGDLVLTAIHGDTTGPITAAELQSWFRHPAGFFAGRGTAKAPRTDAIPVDLVGLAQLIDGWWQR